MKSGHLLAAAALMGVCGSAYAEDTGPFVYVSVGVAKADFNGKSTDDSRVSQANGGATVVSSFNSNPAAYQLNVGYQLGTSFGLQLGYGLTTSIKYSTSAPVAAQATEKLQVVDALISGSHDIGAGFALTLRGGVANVRATGSGTLVHFSGSTTRAAAGAGVKYVIDNHLSVRLDFDSFRAPGGSQIGQVSVFTAGFGYRF